MSTHVERITCMHCDHQVATYYVTCPYCGYRLMDAMQAIGEALPGLGCEDAILAVMKEETE